MQFIKHLILFEGLTVTKYFMRLSFVAFGFLQAKVDHFLISNESSEFF